MLVCGENLESAQKSKRISRMEGLGLVGNDPSFDAARPSQSFNEGIRYVRRIFGFAERETGRAGQANQ